MKTPGKQKRCDAPSHPVYNSKQSLAKKKRTTLRRIKRLHVHPGNAFKRVDVSWDAASGHGPDELFRGQVVAVDKHFVTVRYEEDNSTETHNFLLTKWATVNEHEDVAAKVDKRSKRETWIENLAYLYTVSG
jgi:hypothetical protein